MSLAVIPRPSRPFQRRRMVSGIRIQVSPVTSTPTMSVAPIPNMKQPKAPPVVEWLSPPATNMPGRKCPRSGRTT